MQSHHRIKVAILLCLSTLVIGTSGYMVIEGYSLFEGIYMSVITITTVGFGELKSLSEAGRGFTMFLILLGFGSIAFAGRVGVESLLETAWSGKAEIRKMKKQIMLLKGHYIVCGYGRVGAAAVEKFKKVDAEFVIIEANSAQCQGIREKGYFLLDGDATSETTLLEAGIKTARGLLALLDSDPDNLFIALTARELNPTLHIIARSEEASSEKKILQAGADSVISPFTAAGRRIANDILSSSGQLSRLTDPSDRPQASPQWISVQDCEGMSGMEIGAVSAEMGINVIGLRRQGHDFLFPDMQEKTQASDMLLVMPEEQTCADQGQQCSQDPPKVVIVDDNPVILRLYTRLFKKAGFYPMAATNGEQGLDLIIHEKPAAAVIDFNLPLMSGDEICERVRTKEGLQDTRLIIFTSDETPAIKKRALKAGADEVIIKGPEASEVIDAVIRVLREDSPQDQGHSGTSESHKGPKRHMQS